MEEDNWPHQLVAIVFAKYDVEAMKTERISTFLGALDRVETVVGGDTNWRSHIQLVEIDSCRSSPKRQLMVDPGTSSKLL